jgi:hypothetical protein
MIWQRPPKTFLAAHSSASAMKRKVRQQHEEERKKTPRRPASLLLLLFSFCSQLPSPDERLELRQFSYITSLLLAAALKHVLFLFFSALQLMPASQKMHFRASVYVLQ